jgi:hypothetical protein
MSLYPSMVKTMELRFRKYEWEKIMTHVVHNSPNIGYFLTLLAHVEPTPCMLMYALYSC